MSDSTNEEGRAITLSAAEHAYLAGSKFLPDELVDVVMGARQVSPASRVIALSPDLAEQFRSAFTEQLATVGFGPDYEPTDEGRMLEELIDRFHLREP